MLGIDITQILLHLFNVAILFTGLYILLYSPVKKFMKQREDYYKGLDDSANTKLAEAEEMKNQYAEKLKEVDQEIAGKKKQASREISAMKEQAEIEAKAKADKIITNAHREAESQKKNIVAGARDTIVSMVEDATKKVVLTGDMSEAYDMFLDEAERSTDNG